MEANAKGRVMFLAGLKARVLLFLFIQKDGGRSEDGANASGGATPLRKSWALAGPIDLDLRWDIRMGQVMGG